MSTREDRERIARAANRERGEPRLSATSSKDDLHRWFEARFENWDREYEGGYTLDDLWAEVQNSVGAPLSRGPSRGSAHVREKEFRIPGWSIGYIEEISAHAAVRTPAGKGRDWLFVMTSPEDREPRSLDEEVAVGLYHLDEDGNWEQLGYQDFPDVRAVIKLNDAEIQLLIEHALSMEQARDLLAEEFDDWAEGDGEVSIMPWMATILRDAGVKRPEKEDVEVAASEAIEQIRNASPQQILDYMNERADAINE